MTDEGKDCLKTLVTGSTGFIGSAITRQLHRCHRALLDRLGIGQPNVKDA
jgi:nucleoside-diphosphate-sugar epimerase